MGNFHKLVHPNFLFEGENFMNHQEHLAVNVFSKHFEVIMNRDWFMKIFTLKKPVIQHIRFHVNDVFIVHINKLL